MDILRLNRQKLKLYNSRNGFNSRLYIEKYEE